MTIKEIRHDYLGAEFGLAMCDTCRTRFGSKQLIDIHKGYGEKAKPLTHNETQLIFKAAEDHPKDHSMRIIFGHKENLVDPNTGNSLTLFEVKASTKFEANLIDIDNIY